MKVEIGGVVVHVDDLDQLDRIIARYANRSGIISESKQVNAPAEAVKAAPIVNGATESEPLRRGRARYVPQTIKIPSDSKKEAMFKLYEALGVATHQRALQALAAKGAEGMHISELRKILGVPESYKISGFSAAITRRAPAYGLTGEDILIIEFLGAVAGKRIYRYRLTPEMRAVLREKGLADPGKPLPLESEGGE